jgi:septal ring factor EnvC (AmiA/AmiB activator)
MFAKQFLHKLSFASFIFVLSFGCASGSQDSTTQSPQMRALCKKAQELEKKINKAQAEAESIGQREKALAPLVRDVYEILTRCLTVLFDIQRFSDLLVLNQSQDNKNDFVKCSIVIKNFSSYFRSVGSQLKKIQAEIAKLKKSAEKSLGELKTNKTKYEELLKDVETRAGELARTRVENVIQNDVVYHLATKSESLEELDAELEAENTIGALKNTKISTDLVLAYPVAGKIVNEFGDKGPDNEMICYIAFETCSNAVVTSPAKGLVIFAGKFLNYGNLLIISNGEYRVFLYGMDVLFSSTGDIVEVGDYVGRMKEKTEHNPIIKMELKKSGEPLDPRQWILDTIDKKGKQ